MFYILCIYNFLCTKATIRACLSLVCLTDRVTDSVQDPGMGTGVAAVAYGEAAVM